MQNFTLYSIVALTMLLFSCDPKGNSSENTNEIDPVESVAVPTTDPHAGHNHGTTVGDSTISVSGTPMSTPNVGVTDPNPAHGQPGHRCDIPVGSSLSAAPVNPGGVNPTFQATPTTPVGGAVTTSAPADPVVTDPNAKLNPAHGQPGHDCAIPVGQPLKN